MALWQGEIESGSRVCVVGAGASGVAAARLLVREGALVCLTDSNPMERPALLPRACDFRAGEQDTIIGSQAWDLIVVSPGVPGDLPSLAAARGRDIPVIGELELAAAFVRVPILAITGTNGKSTTTTLLGDMATEAGLTPFIGGNLGTPLCDFILSGAPAGVVILEVSSFQLETVDRFHPHIAAILNIAPDHLDRHGTFEAYAAAKRRIHENQSRAASDFAVYDATDPVVAGFAREANAYAAAVVPEGAASPDPTMPQVRIRHSTAGGGPARLELSDNARSGLSFPGKPVFSDVLTVTNPSLTAPHNLVNVAFAALMARLYGMPLEACQRAIDRFEGLAHRYVTVGEFARMRFIDDSKATNVHAAQVAIRSTPGEIVLLAGGLGKGESYAGLVEAGDGRITRVYTFGTAGPAIADAFSGKAEVRAVGNMAEALTDVAADAIAGATVLLAPACASFDQFKSYKDRGDQFAQFVREKVAAATVRGEAA